MTVKEAIVKADDLRPNAISDEHKFRWVYELEKEIDEMLELPEVHENPYPKDAGLSLTFPDDDLYVYWLCIKIDYYNQDTVLYQNDMLVYQQLLNDIRARHGRQSFRKPALTVKTL